MPAEPTTPKGRKTRQHLVNAGRAVFAKGGYVDARMGDVTIEASISMGGLYRYFENKEDLFAAVIEDLHEQLFQASTSVSHTLRSNPRLALYDSNLGYLRVYRENRDVMRAFIQAAHVEKRFQDIWWTMRQRHVNRFVKSLLKSYPSTEINSEDVHLLAESMACMTEQSAYLWFAQESLHKGSVTLEQAASTTTHIWYSTFFGHLN